MTFEQAIYIMDKRYEETMAKLEIEKQLHAESLALTKQLHDEEMKKRDEEIKIRTEELAEYKTEMKKRDEEKKEYEKKRDEELAEYKAEMKKRDAEMKILTKNFGDATNRLGELVEYMVAPNLPQRFDQFGFYFQTILSRIELKNVERQSVAELDILLLDGDKAMAIEVKTQPKLTDLERHLRRIEKIQNNNISLLKNIKHIYVAIAGAVITPEFLKEAFRLGFYVISQTESNVEIFRPPVDFVANIEKLNI